MSFLHWIFCESRNTIRWSLPVWNVNLDYHSSNTWISLFASHESFYKSYPLRGLHLRNFACKKSDYNWNSFKVLLPTFCLFIWIEKVLSWTKSLAKGTATRLGWVGSIRGNLISIDWTFVKQTLYTVLWPFFSVIQLELWCQIDMTYNRTLLLYFIPGFCYQWTPNIDFIGWWRKYFGCFKYFMLLAWFAVVCNLTMIDTNWWSIWRNITREWVHQIKCRR